MGYKLFVLDVDGTLTDGKIYMGAKGEAMKAFDVKDGYGIVHLLPVLRITPVIITGRHSKIVENRAKELKISELHQGESNKLGVLKRIAEQYGVSPEEIVYIGDDINDLEAMKWCGFSACPADAVDEVISLSDYLCSRKGGRGAVREVIDYLMKTMLKG